MNWTAIGTVTGIIGVIATIIFGIIPLFNSKKESLQYKSKAVIPEKLEYGSNGRFGFSFLYPKSWDRRDPMNGDGNSFAHPKEPLVCMSTWGSFVGTYNYDTLDDIVSIYIKQFNS